MQKITRRFDRHAVSPERVAELIIVAVTREKFFVITSFDIEALYFFKRHFFPVYHFVMKKVSRIMNSMRRPGVESGVEGGQPAGR